MSKFHLICSCTICKSEITTQSLSSHYKKHINSLIPKSNCPTCKSPIFNKNKFCNSSCAATFNNPIKDYSLFTPGPKKGSKSASYFKNPQYTKINWCVHCNKPHTRTGKSCSRHCQSVLQSNHMAIRIANGYNPNHNRGRGKQSYLESSFEQWILSTFPNLPYKKEVPFKRIDMIKTYFVDFYFPTKNIIIELDGTQHNTPTQQLYDIERDQYIISTYEINQIVRISHKDYVKQHRIPEIRALLEI